MTKDRVTAVDVELDITTGANAKRRLTAVYAEVDISTVHPVIASLTPDHAEVGDSVTIAGANFGAAQGSGGVTINGTPATVISWADDEIVITVPAGATTGDLVVTNGDGFSSAGEPFTVDATPAITLLSPDHGPEGETIVITGTDFGAAQGTGGVTFNGTAATITAWGATEITCTVPVGATTGDVIVTAGNGLVSDGEAFTVEAAPATGASAPAIGRSFWSGPVRKGAVLGNPPVQ